MRLVVDTNLWVSHLLNPASHMGTLLKIVTMRHTMLYSDESFLELTEVLARPKFAGYIDQQDIKEFLEAYIRIAKEVAVTTKIEACRDAKDNKFLELAIDGNAKLIISGDKDLLALHPFQGIPILSVTESLAMLDATP